MRELRDELRDLADVAARLSWETRNWGWSAFCQQWIVVAVCASPLADGLTGSQRGDERVMW